MQKLNYLNLGCGSKFHENWVNVDMTSNSNDVIKANLLKGIPFPDDTFEVVYHSQVLEHIPKEDARGFISECYRVLKPGGIIRIVVPDLENIIDEYRRLLSENLENPTPESEANYEWIMLELFDQTVRNFSGGHMANYLRRPELVNERYVIDRIGYTGRNIRNTYLARKSKNKISAYKKFKRFVKSVSRDPAKLFQANLSKAREVGAFRLGGEVHMWMYDRYSLAKLLRTCGFSDIDQKNSFESNIPDWPKYELDVKDGLAFDPTSLFMEARKSG